MDKDKLNIFWEVVEWLENKWQYEPELPHCYNCSHQEVCRKYDWAKEDVAEKRLKGFLFARNCVSYKVKEKRS